MIAIIDYGMGNLRSVQKGFEKIGCDAIITADPHVILTAERIVLPGVGAFRDCMNNLEQGGFVEPILKVIAEGRPFLGICVGMQMLFSDSVEFGLHSGLNVIPGHVLRFPDQMTVAGEKLKVPQMGWNQLSFKHRPPVFDGVNDGSNVYFVHSYYVKPTDSSVIATTTDYGFEFCSSVWRDNIIATQFHPEKSQTIGLRILKNFAELT
jgi:imidazole glycerol-phosphate synthase subunit HisH